MTNSNIKKDTHFIPGFLIGAFFSALLVAFMAWYGPIATRDKVIDESFQLIHEQSVKINELRNSQLNAQLDLTLNNQAQENIDKYIALQRQTLDIASDSKIAVIGK